MININKEILKNLKPCADRWKNYLDHYETFSGSFEEFLFLDKITIADKVFVIKKMIPTKYLVKWTQKCSESVAHLKDIIHDVAASRADASRAAADAADAYAASRAAAYAAAAASCAAAYADAASRAADAADAYAASRAAAYAAAASCAAADAAYAASRAAADAAYAASRAAADAAYADADAAYKNKWEENFLLLIEIIKENEE